MSWTLLCVWVYFRNALREFLQMWQKYLPRLDKDELIKSEVSVTSQPWRSCETWRLGYYASILITIWTDTDVNWSSTISMTVVRTVQTTREESVWTWFSVNCCLIRPSSRTDAGFISVHLWLVVDARWTDLLLHTPLYTFYSRSLLVLRSSYLCAIIRFRRHTMV